MNTIKNLSFVVALMAMGASAHAAKPQDQFLAGEYKIDSDHTRVEFLVDHFVVSQVEGRFNSVEGKIILGKIVSGSSIDATVNTASVDTGVAKRDEDLRSERFLDTVKYPKMTFKSTAFSGTPANFQMIGDLTIKDVTKRVTFTGKYTGTVKDPWGNTRIAFQAKTQISRKDFNVTYNEKVDIGAAVGDKITISIISEGIKI